MSITTKFSVAVHKKKKTTSLPLPTTKSAQKRTPSKSISHLSNRPNTAPVKRRKYRSPSKKRSPKVAITTKTFWSPERRRAMLNKNKNKTNNKNSNKNDINKNDNTPNNNANTANKKDATSGITNEINTEREETDIIQALALGEKSPTKKFNTSWYKKQFSGEIEQVRNVLELNSKQRHDESTSIKIRNDAENQRMLIDILISSRISRQHMTPTDTATLLATFLTPKATDYEPSTFDPSRVYKLLQACRLGKGHLLELRQEFFQCQTLEAKFVSDVLRLSAELTTFKTSCSTNSSKQQLLLSSPSKRSTVTSLAPLLRISSSKKHWHTVIFQRFAPLLAHSLEQLAIHFDETNEIDEKLKTDTSVQRTSTANNNNLAVSSTKVSALHDRVQSMVHMMNESPTKSSQKSQDVVDIVTSALQIGQWSIDHRRTNEEVNVESIPNLDSLDNCSDHVGNVAVVRTKEKAKQSNTQPAIHAKCGTAIPKKKANNATESIFNSPMLWLTVFATGTIAGAVVFVSRKR